MITISHGTDIAELLVAFLQCCMKAELNEDVHQRDWNVFLSKHYNEYLTAFCELVGTPPRGQLLIDMRDSRPATIAGGKLSWGQWKLYRVPRRMIDNLYRLKELLWQAYFPYNLPISDGVMTLYHFMPATHLFSLLQSDQVKVSVPEECNDPLEFKPAASAAASFSQRAPGGFISFSSRYDSSLMWSHYADSHRGVCIEYKFPIFESGVLHRKFDGISGPLYFPTDIQFAYLNLPDDFLSQFNVEPNHDSKVAEILQVNYSKIRPSQSIYYCFAKDEVGKKRELQVSPLFYTKSSEWQYEEEWRLMVSLRNTLEYHDGNFYVKGLTPYISRIILGSNFSQSNSTTSARVEQCLKLNPRWRGSAPKLPDVVSAVYNSDEYRINLQGLK